MRVAGLTSADASAQVTVQENWRALPGGARRSRPKSGGPEPLAERMRRAVADEKLVRLLGHAQLVSKSANFPPADQAVPVAVGGTATALLGTQRYQPVPCA